MKDSEHLANVLRAEANGTDLGMAIHGGACGVFAEREDGTIYELGWVSMGLVLTDPVAARAAIGRIKFRSLPRS